MNLVFFKKLRQNVYNIFVGDIDWGCGFRPLVVQGQNNPSFRKNANFCPTHVHVITSQSTEDRNINDDYDNTECNVSR